MESGRYDEAIEVYKSAIAHAERFSPDLALALGFAYLKHGETAPAAAYARLALATSPREANELLARVALEERRFAAAEQHVEFALQRGDRQPATLLLLADVQRTAGMLDAALRTVQEQVAGFPPLGINPCIAWENNWPIFVHHTGPADGWPVPVYGTPDPCGDVIVAFNSQPVDEPSQFSRDVADAKIGSTATLRGKKVAVEVME